MRAPVFYAIAAMQALIWQIAIPLVPLRVTGLGGSAAAVGAVSAVTALMPLLLGVFVGDLVDRYQPVRVVRAGTGAVALIAAALSQVVSLAWVGVVMALMGLAHTAVVVACQGAVAGEGDAGGRDQRVGYMAFWISTGMLAGPVTGGYMLDAHGFQAAFLSAAGWALLSCTACFLLLRPSPDRRPGAGFGATTTAAALLRSADLRLVLATAFALVSAYSLRISFLPLYLTTIGLPGMLMGTVLSSQSLASLLVRPLLGRAILTFGHVRLLLVALVLALAGTVTMPLVRSLPALVGASLLIGMGMGLSQPLTITMTAALSRGRSVALGMRMSVHRMAQMLTPLAYAAAVSLFGIAAAFYTAAALLVAGGAVLRTGTGHLATTMARRSGHLSATGR